MSLLSGAMAIKTQDIKKQIYKEFSREEWHPSSWWDWCMPKDDKKETEKFCKDK